MTTPETPQPEQKNMPPAESKPDVIPAQYKGMPSEVVEELWQSKVYFDPEKNKAEAERRQQALEAIKKDEADREAAKQQQLSERYSKLPPEQKTEFPTAQTDAGKILNEHIQGKRELDGLSPEESFVLGKLKTAYEEFKKDNPDKPFAFELSRDIDQKVYNNLVQKLAFKVLEGRRHIGDQEKANEIRQELGVPAQEVQTEGLLVPEEESKPETREEGNKIALAELQKFFEKRSVKSKDPEGLRQLFEEIVRNDDRKKIAELLLSETYRSKRTADYPPSQDYLDAWTFALQDNTMPHREENDWTYRGNFPTKEKPTETRGSLNINVSETAIHELDSLIQQGVIDANYKFGHPRTEASGLDRHDSVSIYFLTKPTSEGLKAISEIAKKYNRGDDLIGDKISDGFYMSEVGSVSDEDALDLIKQLQGIDQELADAVKSDLTSMSWTKGKTRTAMSEAKYYTTKEVLKLFGIDIIYDKNKGFEVVKR